MTAEYNAKKRVLLRQAIRENPQLVDLAAQRIQSFFIRPRLEARSTAMEVYQKGGMVAAEINAILSDGILSGVACTGSSGISR